MPSGTSFAKAKSDLIEVDKTINRVLLNARRMYVITLEVAIKRYQHAMWQTLTSYEHKLSVSVGSSGHHIPVVVNIVADLHRIAELNLQTAANIGFTRALEDMKERGWIAKFDQPVVAPRSIVDDSIKENRKYLEQSLLPDLKRDLDQCKNADDVPSVIAKYRSRIFLYGHWSWRTAERAYRDGMKQFVQFADRKHNVREVGTAASGDRGHVGNPGHVGGSGPSLELKVGDRVEVTNAESRQRIDEEAQKYGQKPDYTGEVTSQRRGSVNHMVTVSMKNYETGEHTSGTRFLAEKLKKLHEAFVEVGTAASGDRGHVGRKGHVGGSGPSKMFDAIEMRLTQKSESDKFVIQANEGNLNQKMAKDRGITAVDIHFTFPVSDMPLKMQDDVKSAILDNVAIVPELELKLKSIVSSNTNTADIKGLEQSADVGWSGMTTIYSDNVHANLVFAPKQISSDYEHIIKPDHNGGSVDYILKPESIRQFTHDVVTHELGHVYELTAPKEFQDKVLAIYNDRNPMRLYAPSSYANTNAHEFFAEAYSMYMNGTDEQRTKHIPSSMLTLLNDTFKGARLPARLHESAIEVNNKVHIVGYACHMAEGRAKITYSDGTTRVDHAPMREALVEGGPGSGDRGHLGRRGVVGGSGPAEAPVGHVQTAANEIGVDPNGPAPWDLKAPAPPRYPGDTSIYSPAIPDAHGDFVLGRRIQGLKLDPPNDPNQIAMYTFIPGSVTQDQLAHYEGMIKDSTDHAQTHPGFIAYVDSKGELQRTQGNNYWIRADYRNLNKLSDELTPKLTEQFGKNTFTTMMTNVTPGGVQITKGDALEHMRVVVPFAEGTPKNTVGESSLDRSTRDKILVAMSGSEGRHVWEHADFNGIHIAVSTTPNVVDKLFPVVTALGGLRDKEEETHHNAGATRFIPTKINLERYPVRGYKEAFVEADDTQGVLLYFIGPDDSETCDGCSGAVDGNPYTPDDAPEPGDFECMSRCRHMLQADGDLGDDSATYEWSGSIGFGEIPSGGEVDVTSAVDDAASALQSDIDFDTYMTALASDMDTLDYSSATLDQIDIKNLDEEQLANFTSVMVDSGISLDGLSTMMDLTDAEFSVLQGAFASTFADITDDDLLFMLGNGDVDILQQIVKDVGGDVLEALQDMGTEGFDDENAIEAETLAQVLSKTATLDDNDGRWYVL